MSIAPESQIKFIFIVVLHNFSLKAIKLHTRTTRYYIKWIMKMDNLINQHIFKVGIGLAILLSFIVYGITKDLRLQKQLKIDRKNKTEAEESRK